MCYVRKETPRTRDRFQTIHFAYGSGVGPLPEIVYRTKASLTNRSCVSHVGRAFGDDPLRFANITSILTNPYLLVV